MTEKELGIFGEKLAAKTLENKGYWIIAKNYRYKKHEIDIIALNGFQLVVVEVKTRQTAEIGEPWMAVTKTKQRIIIHLTQHFLEQNDLEIETRFDVISIVHNSFRTNLEHIENAFSAAM